MARTGQTENKQAATTYGAQSKQAFDTGQNAIGNYTTGENQLERTGRLGANPWMNQDYLANVNRLQAGALNAQTEAGKTELQDLNRRTGGMGTSGTQYGIRDLALKKMRLGDQLSAERAATDFDRNQQWQQYLLQSRLAPAQAEVPYYATATGGQGGALANLAHLGAQKNWADYLGEAYVAAASHV